MGGLIAGSRLGAIAASGFRLLSVLDVKDIRVVGMGDCGTPHPGDKPPRYIFLPRRGLRFLE